MMMWFVVANDDYGSMMGSEAEKTYDNSVTLDPRIKARLKYDNKGLVCAVVQQYDTHEVLMVGYMDD